MKKIDPTGKIDTTFGPIEDWQPLGTPSTNRHDFAFQDDSLILLSGNTPSGGYVVRFKPNGQLDSSFVQQGILVLGLYSVEVPDKLHVFPDQSFMVMGTGDSLIWGAKFHPDARLDTRFGQNGLLESPIPLRTAQINRLQVDSSGQITTVIWSSGAGLVAKFTANGSPDPNFGFQGVVALRVEGLGIISSDLHLLGDGRMYVIGFNGQESIVIRLLADGNFDPSYQGLGYTKVSPNKGGSEIFDCLINSNGDIWLAGYQASKRQLSRKYTSTGMIMQLDSLGRVKQTINYPFGIQPLLTQFYDLDQESDSSIIAAGVLRETSMLLARIFTNGNIDPVFAANVQANFFSFPITQQFVGTAVAIQEDGKIIVGGVDDGANRMALIRFLPNGKVDTSFNHGGIVRLNYFGADVLPNDHLWDIQISEDKEIYAVACANEEMITAKIDSTGSFFQDFGNRGISRVAYGFGNANPKPHGLAIRKDKKLVIGGYEWGKAFVIQLLADGQVDPNFGTDGRVQDFLPNGWTQGYAFERLANDRVLIAGTLEKNQDRLKDFAMICFEPDGSPCQDFGQNGKWSLGLGGDDDIIYGLDADGQSNIVLAGSSDGHMTVLKMIDSLSITSISFQEANSITKALLYPNPIRANAN